MNSKKWYYILLLLLLSACSRNQRVEGNGKTDTDTIVADSQDVNNDTIVDNDSAGYSRYYNVLYAYRVDFPRTLLKPHPEASNSDGRVFTDRKGDTILTVYGSRVDTLNLRYKDDLESIKNTHSDERLTYAKLANHFSVISGYRGNSIFYYKRLVTREGLVSLLFEYPKSDSSKFKGVVNAVSRSLKEIDVGVEADPQ